MARWASSWPGAASCAGADASWAVSASICPRASFKEASDWSRCRMRSSITCCFSRTSSRTMATWMFFSSLASCSICLRCSSSSCKASWSTPWLDIRGVMWATSSRGGITPFKTSSAAAEASAGTAAGLVGAGALGGAVLVIACGGGGSSGTSHSPKSMRFRTTSGLFVSAAFLAWSELPEPAASGMNILKPMSSSLESVSTCSCRSREPSKSQSSSTA
mmetsp:Transcript_74750/g.216005  ORF Transcript_74750/g.216005 Transcript_74750/m.216005 type:complete len:218 (+) Transcript_74750:551-1204(+)